MSIELNDKATIYIPDGKSLEEALGRTTHIGAMAHPDDNEIAGFHGIKECFEKKDKWFFAVVLTNGSGSPRTGKFKDSSDEEMILLRREEQKEAADIGKYSGVIILNYPSSAVKEGEPNVIKDLVNIFKAAEAKNLYTHNLFDRHPTHVATALTAIKAQRELPVELKAEHAYGCEVWRSLDWLSDEDKIVFDVSGYEGLAEKLLGVWESQIAGGKNYGEATLARWRANATFHESHEVNISTSLIYAMDLTSLVKYHALEFSQFVQSKTYKFEQDVLETIKRFS